MRNQCDAEFQIYDENGKHVVTFYCLKEKEHEGPHEHTLDWDKKIHKSPMGA